MTNWSDHYVGGGDLHAGLNVQHVKDEPGTLVMYSGKPDWIRDPRTGAKVRCLAVAEEVGVECHNCNHTHEQPVVVIYADVDEYPQCVWRVVQCPACNKYAGRTMPRPESLP